MQFLVGSGIGMGFVQGWADSKGTLFISGNAPYGGPSYEITFEWKDSKEVTE